MKATLLFSGLLIALCLAELTLRIIEWKAYARVASGSNTGARQKLFSDERNMPYVYGHHPNVRVSVNAGEHDYTYFTNSEGLREILEYSNLQASAVFVGDSIVEGACVENQEAIDEVFERLTGIISLNFGVASSNTVHEYYWLRSKYKPDYNAKLIVLGFCLNDLGENVGLRYFDPAVGTWKLHRLLESDEGLIEGQRPKDTLATRMKDIGRRSHLAVLLAHSMRRLASMSDAPALPFSARSATPKQISFTEAYLVQMAAFAQQIGAAFVVVIFPFESQLGMEYEAGGRIQDVVIALLRKHGITFVDLYDIARTEYRAHPDVSLYCDDSHPNRVGHELFGEYLAAELRRQMPDLDDWSVKGVARLNE